MRFSSRASQLAALTVLVLAPTIARAQEAQDAQNITAGSLVIAQPWARATPNGAQVAGGYLTITNTGKETDTLTSGSLAAASRFEIHDMTTVNGIMKMRPSGPIEIPPGSSLTLDPAGRHIMFTGLKQPLRKGETIDGTLVFSHAGTVRVRFSVEGIGAKAAPGHAGHPMPGADMD